MQKIPSKLSLVLFVGLSVPFCFLSKGQCQGCYLSVCLAVCLLQVKQNCPGYDVSVYLPLLSQSLCLYVCLGWNWLILVGCGLIKTVLDLTFLYDVSTCLSVCLYVSLSDWLQTRYSEGQGHWVFLSTSQVDLKCSNTSGKKRGYRNVWNNYNFQVTIVYVSSIT